MPGGDTDPPRNPLKQALLAVLAVACFAGSGRLITKASTPTSMFKEKPPASLKLHDLQEEKLPDGKIRLSGVVTNGTGRAVGGCSWSILYRAGSNEVVADHFLRLENLKIGEKRAFHLELSPSSPPAKRDIAEGYVVWAP